jgi:hypothetical protein
MNWNQIKLRDLEKEFSRVFNPESLYGEQATIYDEALLKSKYYGTTWKEEMQNVNEFVYVDFIVSVLEEYGMTPHDFKEN